MAARLHLRHMFSAISNQNNRPIYLGAEKHARMMDGYNSYGAPVHVINFIQTQTPYHNQQICLKWMKTNTSEWTDSKTLMDFGIVSSEKREILEPKILFKFNQKYA